MGEAKPGALLLALRNKGHDDDDERPAKPDRETEAARDEMRDAAGSMMSAAKRGDADAFVDALEAFLAARG